MAELPTLLFEYQFPYVDRMSVIRIVFIMASVAYYYKVLFLSTH